MLVSKRWLAAAVLAGAGFFRSETAAFAQLPAPNGQFQAIDQNGPVGKAALMMTFRDPGGLPYYQPVLVSLPGEGKVTFLSARPGGSLSSNAPAQAALMVGHTYRLKITDMPEFPGAEIYPSLEVLDRLHPPRGKEHDFPIPLELTREEIELALDGQLVTKLIFLEKPSLAAPVAQEGSIPVQQRPAQSNLIAEADLAGRPMLLVRVGGRLPDLRNPEPTFFGTGAPVHPSRIPPKPQPEPEPQPNQQPPYEEPTTSQRGSTRWAEPAAATDEDLVPKSRPAGHVRVDQSKSERAGTATVKSSRLRISGAVASGGSVNPR